jgi:hypothetical protein
VKRRDLERHLREHGARQLREGGNHSFWGFVLARKICKDLGIPPPPGPR